MKRSLLLLLLVFVLVPSVLAASTAVTDKLNYWTSAENHRVSITNDQGPAKTYTTTLPAGWSWVSGQGCGEAAGTITCASVANGDTVNFTISNPTSGAEYTVTTLSITSADPTMDIKFLKIDPVEIFHTLVEFGRGRGNYFYDTGGEYHDLALTAKVPNGTNYELNYLHKVVNVAQYYGLPSSIAEDASWTCVYPNDTSVRQHQATSTARGAVWTVGYGIEEIDTSWERMGYFGQRVDSGTYLVGTTLLVNCTDIVYRLDDAGGNMSIDEDSFTLEIRNREPFSASGSTSATVGNGTQEVEITYTITNNEIYSVDSVQVEIEAPQYATFIGTRSELWGVGRDKYIMERTEIAAGASERITLVARFDTSAAGSISSVNLSEGMKIKYVTPWEVNAYNPQSYIQDIPASGIGTVPVNMGVSAEIRGLPDLLDDIFDLVTDINKTTFHINQTTTTIETYVKNIDGNITNTIIPSLTTIEGYTDSVEAYTDDVEALLNCTLMPANSVCYRLDLIQNYTDDLEGNQSDVLNAITNLNDTMNARFDLVDGNLTEVDNTLAGMITTLNELRGLLNCSDLSTDSVCERLDRMEQVIDQINATTENIEVLTTEINTTTHDTYALLVVVNNTVQEINSSIGNLSLNVDLTGVEGLITNLTNCTAEPNAPLCVSVDAINSSVNDIINAVGEINQTTQTTQDNLESNMSMVADRFNQVDGNLSEIRTNINGIYELVNCTSTPSAPLCSKLDSMNLTLSEINATTHTSLNVINYINNTRWGSLTAQDIYNLINNTQQDTETILTKIRQLREFEEEAIFLVTDSYGLQADARDQMASGDINGALNSLREANEKLKEAAQRIESVKKQATEEAAIEQPSEESSGLAGGLFMLMVVVVLGCIVAFFYFTRRRQGI
jgi:hypothetical protein